MRKQGDSEHSQSRGACMRRLILPAVAVLLSAVSGCDQRTSSPLGPRDASARLSALERASASRFKVSASLYRPSPAESTLIERLVKNFPPEDRDQLRAAFIPRGPALLVGIQFTNNPTAQALADSIFALRSRDAQARLNAHGLQVTFVRMRTTPGDSRAALPDSPRWLSPRSRS